MDEWPETKPDVLADDHGWFQKSNEEVFKMLLNDETKLVIELGSWLGKSTKFIAEHAPNAQVIAIDHWEGSPEHQGRPDVKYKLPNLYDTFLVNLWEYKDRVRPLKMTTKEGLRKCYEEGLKPDFIHVDAAHDYDGVMDDIKAAKSYFPDSCLVGDDWNWKNLNNGERYSVREAVIDYSYKNAKLLNVFLNVWWMK